MEKNVSRLNIKFYTLGEEIANAITHGIGAGLGVWGLVMMILKASDPWQTVSACIYGGSLILLFTMSCLYHALANDKGKRVMRVFDHTSIFLLIAGTYTPYTLVTIRGGMGWTLFGIVWAAAIVGIVLNAVSIERFKTVSMVCYIAAGWCVVIAIVPMIRNLSLGGMLLLLVGGLLYTGGILFYRKKSVRWFHTIWHVFVVLAALLHFLSIYLYVLG